MVHDRTRHRKHDRIARASKQVIVIERWLRTAVGLSFGREHAYERNHTRNQARSQVVVTGAMIHRGWGANECTRHARHARVSTCPGQFPLSFASHQPVFEKEAMKDAAWRTSGSVNLATASAPAGQMRQAYAPSSRDRVLQRPSTTECNRDGALCVSWTQGPKEELRQNLQRIHADTGAAMCGRIVGSQMTGLWAR